jgi:riboflavin kinase/FMN adenylyltransferase
VEDILLDKIGVKEIVVGYDYTFGRNRQGNTGFLQQMGNKLGFKVHLVGPVHVGNTPVSSTSIRRLLQEGNLAEAKELLGRDYQIWGSVVKGQNRGGRLLGFPTANIKLTDQLLPMTGVYAVTVEVDGGTCYGVTNIGYNPTFGVNAISLETHLLDFSQNILGKMIKVNFLHRLRGEKHFSSIQELSDQIARDIRQANDLFGL